MLTAPRLLDRLMNTLDCSPWGSTTGRSHDARPEAPRPLYTPDQRRRRDMSPWTRVQGVLAIVQFAVFLTSLALVLGFLATGEGLLPATASVCLKTLVLYAIMVTGAVWEKEIFGRYPRRCLLLGDMFSILVIALHTAYVGAVLMGFGDASAADAHRTRGLWRLRDQCGSSCSLRAARRDEQRSFSARGLTS